MPVKFFRVDGRASSPSPLRDCRRSLAGRRRRLELRLELRLDSASGSTFGSIFGSSFGSILASILARARLELARGAAVAAPASARWPAAASGSVTGGRLSGARRAAQRGFELLRHLGEVVIGLRRRRAARRGGGGTTARGSDAAPVAREIGRIGVGGERDNSPARPVRLSARARARARLGRQPRLLGGVGAIRARRRGGAAPARSSGCSGQAPSAAASRAVARRVTRGGSRATSRRADARARCWARPRRRSGRRSSADARHCRGGSAPGGGGRRRRRHRSRRAAAGGRARPPPSRLAPKRRTSQAVSADQREHDHERDEELARLAVSPRRTGSNINALRTPAPRPLGRESPEWLTPQAQFAARNTNKALTNSRPFAAAAAGSQRFAW